jgi:hypothetical protein
LAEDLSVPNWICKKRRARELTSRRFLLGLFALILPNRRSSYRFCRSSARHFTVHAFISIISYREIYNRKGIHEYKTPGQSSQHEHLAQGAVGRQREGSLASLMQSETSIVERSDRRSSSPQVARVRSAHRLRTLRPISCSGNNGPSLMKVRAG